MKASITCRQEQDWVAQLPIVLLGLRSAYKADIDSTPAEMLYGATLRLPGEYFVEGELANESEFVKTLRQHMRAVKPTTTAHHIGNENLYEPPSLRTATHVFVRDDTVRPPLTAAYNGPFLVKKRCDKYFVVNCKGRESKISVDRLKPAHILKADDDLPSVTPKTTDQLGDPVTATTSPPSSGPVISAPRNTARTARKTTQPPAAQTKVTRFGRQIKIPRRLNQIATLV